MSKLNDVVILFNGYSNKNDQDTNYMQANCTCTLIKGCDGYNVIVDTMTPWDGPKILDALKQNSIKPDDINAVVSTHGHSDHTGNNNLFLNADWHIVGQCASKRDQYLIHYPWTPFELTDDISVIATPGHTFSCVSVIVQNTNLNRKVAICGDLFEKQEDIDDSSIWIDAGSEDAAAQRVNRAEISATVDLIVPGHGKPFKVTIEIREKLRNQLENN